MSQNSIAIFPILICLLLKIALTKLFLFFSNWLLKNPSNGSLISITGTLCVSFFIAISSCLLIHEKITASSSVLVYERPSMVSVPRFSIPHRSESKKLFPLLLSPTKSVSGAISISAFFIFP